MLTFAEYLLEELAVGYEKQEKYGEIFKNPTTREFADVSRRISTPQSKPAQELYGALGNHFYMQGAF